MVKWSSDCASLPFYCILTLLRCVFIDMSTLVIVPTTTDPFLSSMVTVSPASFIKNLTNFILFFLVIKKFKIIIIIWARQSQLFLIYQWINLSQFQTWTRRTNSTGSRSSRISACLVNCSRLLCFSWLVGTWLLGTSRRGMRSRKLSKRRKRLWELRKWNKKRMLRIDLGLRVRWYSRVNRYTKKGSRPCQRELRFSTRICQLDWRHLQDWWWLVFHW